MWAVIIHAGSMLEESDVLGKRDVLFVSWSYNLAVPVLYCIPRTTNASFSPGREQVANTLFFFNTVLSLRVALSPHFLSFFLRLSPSLRSGLVFLPAWRRLAALSLPARPIHPF